MALQIVAFRFISLQIVSFHCIVANFACNECNDATKGFSENEYFATLPTSRHDWQSTF